jgi:hypothetical protein
MRCSLGRPGSAGPAHWPAVSASRPAAATLARRPGDPVTDRVTVDFEDLLTSARATARAVGALGGPIRAPSFGLTGLKLGTLAAQPARAGGDSEARRGRVGGGGADAGWAGRAETGACRLRPHAFNRIDPRLRPGCTSYQSESGRPRGATSESPPCPSHGWHPAEAVGGMGEEPSGGVSRTGRRCSVRLLEDGLPGHGPEVLLLHVRRYLPSPPSHPLHVPCSPLVTSLHIPCSPHVTSPPRPPVPRPPHPSAPFRTRRPGLSPRMAIRTRAGCAAKAGMGRRDTPGTRGTDQVADIAQSAVDLGQPAGCVPELHSVQLPPRRQPARGEWMPARGGRRNRLHWRRSGSRDDSD